MRRRGGAAETSSYLIPSEVARCSSISKRHGEMCVWFECCWTLQCPCKHQSRVVRELGKSFDGEGKRQFTWSSVCAGFQNSWRVSLEQRRLNLCCLAFWIFQSWEMRLYVGKEKEKMCTETWTAQASKGSKTVGFKLRFHPGQILYPSRQLTLLRYYENNNKHVTATSKQALCQQ